MRRESALRQETNELQGSAVLWVVQDDGKVTSCEEVRCDGSATICEDICRERSELRGSVVCWERNELRGSAVRQESVLLSA